MFFLLFQLVFLWVQKNINFPENSWKKSPFAGNTTLYITLHSLYQGYLQSLKLSEFHGVNWLIYNSPLQIIRFKLSSPKLVIIFLLLLISPHFIESLICYFLFSSFFFLLWVNIFTLISVIFGGSKEDKWKTWIYHLYSLICPWWLSCLCTADKENHMYHTTLPYPSHITA